MVGVSAAPVLLGAMSVPRAERLSAARVASHLAVMVVVAAVLGVVVAGLAIPFAGVLGFGARNVAADDGQPAGRARDRAAAAEDPLLDADGNMIATLYDENRVNVSLDQISRTMVKAIVAIEDYRFYEHGALDLKGTLRALVTNQANDGVGPGWLLDHPADGQADPAEPGRHQGRARRPRSTTPTRASSRELRYAIAFEQQHSKDWILERYLNIAYFGDGAYGVQAAARHYFNINAKDLNLRESAMLAGLVKNPTGYDPTNSPDRALERRNVVLDRMAELNVITPREGGQDQGARPRPRRRAAPRTAASTRGRRSSATTSSTTCSKDPALGETVDGAPQAAQDRRPDDPHHRRPA